MKNILFLTIRKKSVEFSETNNEKRGPGDFDTHKIDKRGNSFCSWMAEQRLRRENIASSDYKIRKLWGA